MAKTAVVTGGNKGIGLETARMFLDRGCEVFVVARDFADFPLASRPGVHAVPFDLAEVENIPALIAQIGHVDILVNNAGIMNSIPHDQYTRERSDRLMRVNLEAPVALTTAAAES